MADIPEYGEHTSSGRTVERVFEPDLPVVYANSVEVGMSVYDIMLVFGQTRVTSAQHVLIHQLVRVMVSPQHAKVLSKILADKVVEYETQFGAIPSAPDAETYETIQFSQPASQPASPGHD